jgi:putative glutamine amidotransferase
MESRPRIGICTSLELAGWSVWEQLAALLPYIYIEAIQRAGGMALMIPPDPALIENPDELLDVLDGLIMAGGADIHPQAYGQAAEPETTRTNPLRDDPEIALTRRAIERDIPFLGICRGMQLLNVARGGTLHQHLPRLLGHDHHRRNPGTFDGSDHRVLLEPGSLAARAAGEEQHRTFSHHHQGIDRLGDGLAITGYSAIDELPEAIELPGSRFVLGVQWHPEADESSHVVAVLVEEARAYRAAALAAAG